MVVVLTSAARACNHPKLLGKKERKKKTWWEKRAIDVLVRVVFFKKYQSSNHVKLERCGKGLSIVAVTGFQALIGQSMVIHLFKGS